MTWKPWAASVVLLAGMAGAALSQDRSTILMTFPTGKIGPVTACDGQLELTAGKLSLRPWLLDAGDSIDKHGYKLATEHNLQSAAKTKLRKIYRPTLTKGLLLEVEAPDHAILSGRTKLGDFEIPLTALRKGGTLQALGGRIRLQRIPPNDRLTGDQAEEEYPSVTILPDGRRAVAYVAWDGTQDRLMLRLGDETRCISEQPRDYLDPRCICDGQGKLWVVWTAAEQGQWDLWAWCDDRTQRLTRGPRNQFWPRLARDAKGHLWLAWQTVADDLHYEVMLAQLGPQGLGPAANVSQHPGDDWEPVIAATPDGRVAVAWDTYRNGSYDIYLREFTAAGDKAPRALKEPMAVAASAQREAHATIAADPHNRLWLAWDVSMKDWGKHPDKGGTLHAWRSSEVACYAGGKLQRPAVSLMDSLPKAYKKFVEYPTVAVDGRGRLWVLFRFSNEVRAFYKAPGTRAQNYAMWLVFATQWNGHGWTTPVLLAGSNGRQDIRVDTACDANGDLLVAYGADGRTRRLPYVPVDYDVHLASLAGFGAAVESVELVDAGDLGRVEPAAPDAELEPLPRRWTVGSETYRALLGDTHRHTDISRCMNGYDGSLQDAYRYALDASGLDFLAISDHDQDLLKHRADRKTRPRQDYDWWRSQKCCDLYTIPGRFVALYGYEHGGSYKARGGHKNVVVAQRGEPVEEVDAPHALFAALADSGAIAIPHQLADGGSRTDWKKWDSEYERVGEIFQTRGSYEFDGCPRAASIFTTGHSIWEALAGGVRIGIIASSDHGQTHQARAGVYVEDESGAPNEAALTPGFTREGILDGLRARRAYGATTSAVLRFSIEGKPLGQEIRIKGRPRIQASLAAPAAITRLDVVRDGRFVYTSRPGKPQSAFEFTDHDLPPGGSAYYYLRAEIGKHDLAWSSPIWVTREDQSK